MSRILKIRFWSVWQSDHKAYGKMSWRGMKIWGRGERCRRFSSSDDVRRWQRHQPYDGPHARFAQDAKLSGISYIASPSPLLPFASSRLCVSPILPSHHDRSSQRDSRQNSIDIGREAVWATGVSRNLGFFRKPSVPGEIATSRSTRDVVSIRFADWQSTMQSARLPSVPPTTLCWVFAFEHRWV